MTRFGVHFILFAALTLSLPVMAHEPELPTPPLTVVSAPMPVFVQNIDPDAVAAVAVVDAFSAAIKAGKMDDAANCLDPTVLILESGSSERSRDEYLAEHALADAAFMQTAKQQLRYRQAQAEGDVVWVGTESLLDSTEDGQARVFRSTETMVLKKTDAGWMIVHIHWSSRPVP